MHVTLNALTHQTYTSVVTLFKRVDYLPALKANHRLLHAHVTWPFVTLLSELRRPASRCDSGSPQRKPLRPRLWIWAGWKK